jgi:hypothetical protein
MGKNVQIFNYRYPNAKIKESFAWHVKMLKKKKQQRLVNTVQVRCNLTLRFCNVAQKLCNIAQPLCNIAQ